MRQLAEEQRLELLRRDDVFHRLEKVMVDNTEKEREMLERQVGRATPFFILFVSLSLFLFLDRRG